MDKKKPVVLVVLDGWGIDAAHEHNGVHVAQTPNFDRLSNEFPYTELHASGEHVGLPDGQMGNSEVGHTTIGAGTVVYQDLVRISKDAKNGDFIHNPAMQEAFTHTRNNNSQLHLMGLLSEGGVHAHEDHLIEVARAAKKSGVTKIVLHPFLDGRDAAPTGGIHSLRKLAKEAAELSTNGTTCRIATVIGRYYSMDRDKNWDRTDKAFQAIFDGEAKYYLDPNDSLDEAIQRFYDEGLSDEHIEPIVISQSERCETCGPDHEHYPFVPDKVNKGDSLIFTNFRTDRTKQLSAKIGDIIEDYDLCFVTMTDYGKDVTSIVAYEPQSIEATLASAIADADLPQAHIAETEKYPHATYFLNGGKEDAHTKEEHVLIPSNKHVKTHDEAPEMKAKEICDAAIERLGTNAFIFVNFANPDMVGHTANQKAIVTAVETVDRELGRLADAVLEHDGVLLAIADHGNAERMVDPATGAPHTAHTTNPVPCILVSNAHKAVKLKKEQGLKDVAPTVLAMLGVDKPASMTGESLIVQTEVLNTQLNQTAEAK